MRDVWTWVRTRKHRRAADADPHPSIFTRATPSVSPVAPTDAMVMTWVGHTTFLIQLGGWNTLLDPVWSERASPVQFAGPRRLVPPGIDFDALPAIDAVVLSHDHYDHLDRRTVHRLVRAHPEARWFVPLGVGEWLRQRGVRVAAELDWWKSVSIGGMSLTCTPAQHFSGRKLTNRNDTLWSGWTIRAASHTLFFAGDTALHPEFEVIARRLGPFDAAIFPIGAYEPRWFMRPVHMSPEEAVTAYTWLRRGNAGHPCTFVASHWGTFKLTDEPMDEPPRLTRTAWHASGLDEAALWIPRHGETRRWDRGESQQEIQRAP